MTDRRRTADELLGELDRVRGELHALPHVVGTAVGLHDDHPVVEVHVDLDADEVAGAVHEIVDAVLDRSEVTLVLHRSLPSAHD